MRSPNRIELAIHKEEGHRVLGEEKSMDLLWLCIKVVLHIADNAIGFNAATFLDSHGEIYDHSLDGIWNALIKNMVQFIMVIIIEYV